jgi:hypothetical protein
LSKHAGAYKELQLYQRIFALKKGYKWKNSSSCESTETDQRDETVVPSNAFLTDAIQFEKAKVNQSDGDGNQWQTLALRRPICGK